MIKTEKWSDTMQDQDPFFEDTDPYHYDTNP